MALRALSLCAGIGGIDLGLAPWTRTVCYVERNPYAVRVLERRIGDGRLDDAPIWEDLRTFDARAWYGAVDLVTAGFPCQPFSTASRGRRVHPDLWPEVFRIVRDCEPSYVFLENVAREPIQRAAADLERVGYSSHADPFDAAELGAPSPRRRWWLLAHAHRNGERAIAEHEQVGRVSSPERLDEWRSGPGGVLRMDARVPRRMDRLHALGNAVVPQCAALAFRILSRRIVKGER